jgi:hypothetical protein
MASNIQNNQGNASGMSSASPVEAAAKKTIEVFGRIVNGTFHSRLDSYISGNIHVHPLSGGASKPLKIEKMGGTGSPCVLKISRLEYGYRDSINSSGSSLSGSSDPSSSGGVGCPPGTGAFVELLVNQFIGSLLLLDKSFGELCIVPGVAFAVVNPEAFSGIDVHLGDIPVTQLNGTCVIQEFVSNCFPVTPELLKTINPLALEILAVIDIITINTDRHEGNLLLKRDERGGIKTVMIDHGNCLPRGGIGGARFCWLGYPGLDKSPSDKIQDVIMCLNIDLLASMVDRIQSDLARQNETQKFGFDRILPHMIAVIFLQEAILDSWSLQRIGRAFTPDFLNNEIRIRGGIVQSIYDEVCDLPRESLKERIRDICRTRIELANLITNEDSLVIE